MCVCPEADIGLGSADVIGKAGLLAVFPGDLEEDDEYFFYTLAILSF